MEHAAIETLLLWPMVRIRVFTTLDSDCEHFPFRQFSNAIGLNIRSNIFFSYEKLIGQLRLLHLKAQLISFGRNYPYSVTFPTPTFGPPDMELFSNHFVNSATVDHLRLSLRYIGHVCVSLSLCTDHDIFPLTSISSAISFLELSLH